MGPALPLAFKPHLMVNEQMKQLPFSLLVALFILPSVSLAGSQGLTTINIVSQEWIGQTNADGTGLYFELLNEIYKPLGIAVHAKIVPFDRAVMMLRNQSIDASVGFYSAEDAKMAGWYFYLTPLHPIDAEKMVAIFKKGSVKQWEFPQSLTNRKVTWIQGYTLDKNIKTVMDYHPVSDHKQAWKLLKIGRIDFYLDSEVDALAAARENGVELSEYRIETMWTRKVYVPFAKTPKSRQLMEIFDRRMAELRTSGALERLYRKWQRELPPDS